MVMVTDMDSVSVKGSNLLHGADNTVSLFLFLFLLEIRGSSIWWHVVEWQVILGLKAIEMPLKENRKTDLKFV